jgi:hypothetical protein
VIYSPTVDCCDPPLPPDISSSASSAGIPTGQHLTGVPRGHWQRGGTVLGAVVVALLPKCPACWSVYAGLSSVLGLSFVVQASYLLPLTASLLALSLGALWLQARRGRGWGPLRLATVGALATLAGKFAWESDPVLYAGLGALLTASLWSSCRWGWLATRAALPGAPPASASLSTSASLPAQN